MHFNWEINFGNLLSMTLFIGVLIKLHSDILKQLTILNVKVDTMWAEYIRGKK